MKRRFTYKELTLVIGVLVAIIIWLTMRFAQGPTSPTPTTSKGNLPRKTSEVVQQFLKKAVSEVVIR